MVDISKHPALQIGYLLHHLSTTLAKQSDQLLLERLGVGFSQFKIMKIVQKHPNVTQRTIAEQLGQTEASISRQIKLLQEKGLVQVVVSAENRREHHSELTPKGARLVDEVFRVLTESYAPMFAELGEKRQKQLVESLTVMHEHVCVGGKIGACDQLHKK